MAKSEPKALSLIKQNTAILDQAKALKITNDQQFLAAGDLLKTIKALRLQVSETHDSVIQHWHEKHKEAIAEKRKDDQPLAEAEMILKQRWSAYDQDQKRKLREEEERLQREAIREAEERKLAEVAELIEEGREDEAAQLIEAPIQVQTAAIELTQTKSDGISSRQTYQAKVFDMRALVKAIASGQVPIEAVEPNMSFLHGQARLIKREGLLYSGVQVVSGTSVSTRL